MFILKIKTDIFIVINFLFDIDIDVECEKLTM